MELIVLLVVGFIFFGIIKWLTASNEEYDLKGLPDKVDRLEQKVASLQRQVSLLQQKISASQETEMLAQEIPAPSLIAETETAEAGPVQTVTPQPTVQLPAEQPAVQAVAEEIPPTQESLWEKAEKTVSEPNPIWQWLVSGNPILKIGVVVLFLGLAFLLRFASEHFSFSIEARYYSVAAIGVVCGIIGWRLRHSRREYGLTMQGAAFAILYLTALATLKLHTLLPPLPVFAVQVGLVILMTFLAVIQNARILAQVAVLGGLASPVLISDGSGNYLALFSYLALLNAGVAGVAWFKSWRSLNIIGATGTFLIAAAWGMQYYRPDYFSVCQVFLIYHTALYTFIVWRFARLKAAECGQVSLAADNNAPLGKVFSQWRDNMLHIGILDGGLLFGVAFAAFWLQSGMADFWQYGVMWSCLGLAAFYGLFGYWILRSMSSLKTVAEAMLFLSLVFVTLAIGNSFDSWQRTTLWAIEALLLYWFGIRQASPVSRIFALGLFIGAWLFYNLSYTDDLARYSLLNSLCFAIAGFLCYGLWQYFRRNDSAQWEKNAACTILIITLYLTFMLPFYEYQLGRLSNAQSAVISLSVLLAFALAQWRRENAILTVFSIVGLFAALFQYHFSSSVSLSAYFVFAAGGIAWSLHNPRRNGEKPPFIQETAGYIGLGLAIPAFFYTLDLANLFSYGNLNYALYLIITFAVVAACVRFLRWRQAGMAALAFVPLLGLLTAVYGMRFPYPAVAFFTFVLALVLHALIMFMQHHRIALPVRTLWHTLGLYVLLLNFTRLTVDQATSAQLDSGWLMPAFALAPLLALGGIVLAGEKIYRWQLESSYFNLGGGAVVGYLIGWALIANIHSSGAASPLPYIPLLNPLELTSLAAAYLVWRWLKFSRWKIARAHIATALGGFGLFMLSVVTMRVWHHYAGIEWRFENLVRSFSVQASLSVIWAVSAIILMLRGTGRNERTLWFAGAGLMGVVVVKLFAVELGDSGGIARIVSFIVVGVLLLLVGYFAPLPPKEQAEKKEA